MSIGNDLMNDISNGSMAIKSSAYAEKVKIKVTDAMVEILMFGARVRPLLLNGKRVGWAKAMSFSEKKQIDTWYSTETERIETTLTHTTSLTQEEIDSLDMVELNSVLRAVLQLNLADLSLFPYISAFVSTQASFNLWSSKLHLEPKTITLPDGLKLRQLSIPDHTMLWAALSSSRMDTINRLENAQNAGTIARAFVGTGADNYNNAINKALTSLRSDSIDPWMELINFMNVKELQNFNDGYGHSHQDSSVEGLMREMKGMSEGDKHEELMNAFHQTQIRMENEKIKQMKELAKRRRALDEVDESTYIIRTAVEVKKKEALLKQQNYGWVLDQQKQLLLDQESGPPQNRWSKYL